MAPSLVATYTAELSAAGTLQTAAFTPAEGELLVVKAVGSHSAVTLGAPTGGGLTFTSRATSVVTNYTDARLDTAVVPAGQAAMTVSVPVTFTTGTTWQSSLIVERWTGAKLATTPATNATKIGATTTAFAVSLTTTAADSVVTWVGGDWTPVTTGTPTYRDSAVANYQRRTSAVNVWSASQPAATAGTVTFGMTAPTGQKWTALGIELLASTRVEDVTDTFAGTTPSAVWTDVNGAGDQDGSGYVNANQNAGAAVYSARRTARALTLFGSSLTIQVVAFPAGGTAFAQLWVRAITAAGALQGRLGFEYRSATGMLDLVGQTDTYAPIGTTVSITFDPVAHRHLRLRHDGTSILWQTSPDRGTWTTQRTLAATAAPGWVTSSVLQLSIEAYRTAGTNDTLRVDNLNVLPAGPAPRSLAVGEPVELESAQPVARRRARQIGQALDTSTATAVAGRARRRDVAQATELDAGLPVSARRPGEARQAREVDSASPVGRAHARALTGPVETDTATPVRRARRRLIGQAVDASTATPLARSRRRDVAQAVQELDTASPVGRRHSITLGQAIEAELSRAIAGRLRRRDVRQATSSETGRPVRLAHRRDVGQALSFEVALQLAQSAGIVTEEAFAAAIAAPERIPYGTLRVDWDGDNFGAADADLSENLRTIEIERSLDGDLPEGAGLIDGYATATLKAELGGTRRGATMPLAAELSPFRPDSPRYGKRKTTRTVAGEIGLVTEDGPKALRLFTGPLRDVSLEEGPRSVTLDAVDPSERLRALVTLPTYGEFVTHARRRKWALTVNSAALVDAMLRRNGIFASPPPRAEAIIVATGHGGLFAERGFNGAPISIYGSGPSSGLWVEDGHPYGMLGTPESPSYGTVGYQEFYGFTDGVTVPLKFQAGYGFGVSQLVHIGSGMRGGSSVENRHLQIRVTEREYPRLFVNVFGNGEVYAGLSVDASTVISTPRIPTGPGPWRFLGWHFRWTSDTTLEVRCRVDGQTRLYALTVPKVSISETPTPTFGGYRPIVQVNGQLARSWSNLQAWPSYAPPPAGAWQGESWTSQADIGRGNNELVYLPDVASADSWDVLKAVVSAEYAVHGFTEFGRYYFRPRTDVRPDRVDHYLDVDANLAEVAYSFSSDTIRNSVGVTTSASYHSGELQAVVKAQDVEEFVCGVGTSLFELDWPHGAAGYQGGILQYHYQEKADTAARDAAAGYPMWSGDVVHGWTYSSRGASGNWTILDNTRSVVCRYVQTSSRKVQLRVSNPGPGPIRLATAMPADASSEGEPAMRIGGWPLEKDVDRVTTWTNEESIRALGGREGGGERSLPIPASEWRQSDAPFSPVAVALLEALAEETPILEDLPVRGDPRIRAGNVAACRFLDGQVTVTGTVVKARHQLDAEEGLYQTLVSVRPLPVSRLAPPGVEFYVDISRYQATPSATHQSAAPAPLDLGRLRVLGYAGCVAKIGQGAGVKANGDTLGAVIDPYWTTWRDQSLALWPQTTAGYWYVGSSEAPADQASRCLAAIGDPSIPVMLDWEDGAGSFANLLAVMDAFRAAGLLVTMVYAGRGYASANAPSGSSLAGRGVSLVSARYWVDTAGGFPTPREDWDDQRAGFGFEPFLGLTPAANQFTQWGTPYFGSPYTDVDAFRGTQAQLAAMFHGE